jgi:hypothetical protein
MKRRHIGSVVLLLVLSLAARVPAGELEWKSSDIGSPAAAGGHETDGRSVKVCGAGKGATSQRDQLHLAWVSVTGDVEIVARVAAVDAGAAAGIMLRADSAEDAPMAGVLYARAAADGQEISAFRQVGRDPEGRYKSRSHGSRTHLAPPVWLKLCRIGNDYAAFRSADGVAWVMIQNNSGGSLHGGGRCRRGCLSAAAMPPGPRRRCSTASRSPHRRARCAAVGWATRSGRIQRAMSRATSGRCT